METKTDLGGNPRGGVSWRQALRQYCNDTSLHGLKHVAEPQPFLFRRLVWLILVLAGIGLFLSQMLTSILHFRSWPVSVNVRMNHNDTIRFPAVAICNQNSFSCEWDNTTCGPDDFVTTLTDFGVCYTFNSLQSNKPLRHARRTGAFGGLRLRLNVEQYEYMAGPNEGAGMKILVYEQNEIPLVRDFGLAIPPGFHALVAVKIIEIRNQPPPYGKCDDSVKLEYFDDFTSSKCPISHLEAFTHEMCNCRAMYMPANGQGLPSPCTLEQHQSCYLEAERLFQASREYECPISCSRTAYDTSVSYAVTSDFDADVLLRSNMSESLAGRYLHAREVSQRVNKHIVKQDRATIDGFTAAETKLSSVLDRILLQMSKVRFPLSELMSKLYSRIHFHWDRGLSEQDYMMSHNFARGWEVFQERSLNHVTANFYDIPRAFESLLLRANQSTDDEEHIKKSVWLVVEDMLMGRVFIVSMAKDNISQADYAYKTATPLLTYRATIDRRYDLTYISVDLLQAADNRQQEYFSKLKGGLDRILKGLHDMHAVGQTFIESGHFDQAVFKAAEKTYLSGCRTYNYRVFLFQDRIVKGPLETIQKKEEDFLKRNRSLANAHDQVLLSIQKIETAILSVKADYGVISRLARDSELYLRNNDVKKTPLSKQITSKEITKAVQTLVYFFRELRARDRDFRDAWADLERAVADVWTTMLKERHLDEFYKMVHRDYVDFMTNTTKEGFYLRIFASMLRTDVSFLERANFKDITFLMNADFHNSSLQEKLSDIHDDFSRFLNDTAVSETLGDTDEQFLKAFETYQTSLASFLKDSEIDLNFYRDNFMRLDIFIQELSYEEIIQQRAYDLTNLFSDIGGSLGLFVGASVLSIFEFFDVIIHTSIRSTER